jgi:hypothetical protein
MSFSQWVRTLARRLNNLVRRFLLSVEQALRKLSSFRPSKKILLLIGVVVAITVIAHTMIAQWLNYSEGINVPSVGTIHFWGVEASGGNLETINSTKSIDWGTLYLGASRKVSFMVKSLSNLPIEIAYNITGLSPEDLAQFLTLRWNYNGTILYPEEQIPIEFTLSLSSSTETLNYLTANKVTTFTLDISIYASNLEP